MVQAFGFPRQRVTGENAGDARVAVGKGQQQQQHLLAAQGRGALLIEDDLDTTEQRVLDELDKTFEHLGLAGEMSVQGGFGYPDLASQSGGGNAIARVCFQHLG